MKKSLSSLLAAVLLLTGCGTASTAAAPAATTSAAETTAASTAFQAGTYTGVGQGLEGPIKVEVTFSDDAITDIKVVEHNETKNVSDPALERIPQEILDTQSLSVDVVTSVTMTSYGVINAVKDACEQAGGDISALSEKVEKTVPADETIDTDVVVVGMGLAGVAASAAAVDAGVKVVAVEKSSVPGGSSKYSGGFITAVNSKYQKEAGYDLDVDGYMDYFNASEDLSEKEDETDRDAVRAMIERSADTIDWLEAHDDPLTGPSGFGSSFTVWHYPADRTSEFDGFAAGSDHINALMNWLSKKDNLTVYYDTPATEITTDADGKVSGIVCTREDGSKLTVNAKSVILACGGWAASQEMMARFCPEFPQEWVIPYTTASLGDTGDGITMAEKIGADIYQNGWWMDLAPEVDPLGPSTYFPGTLNQLINYANYFVTDGTGKRIYGTGGLYGPRSIAIGKAMKETGKVWSIFTEEGWADGIKFIEENDRVDDKEIFKADTLEELAEKTGMDKDVLQEQVDRYNGFCASETDEDYGQMMLTPINDGPYYAVSIKTATMGTIGGLKTNDDDQVLDTEGNPIEGLWAAGELINGKYFNQCYISGDAQLLCADSGILTGTKAAEHATGN